MKPSADKRRSSAQPAYGATLGKLNEKIEISGGNVAVVCRFRPLNEKEKGKDSGKI